MHSKIIQISDKPIAKEDYIDDVSYIFHDGFVGWIADYVDDVDDEDLRLDFISDFKDSIHNAFPEFVSMTKDTLTFKKGFEEEYQKVIREAILRIAHDTENFSMMRYAIRDLLDDPFGYYVYRDGWGTMTEGSFLSDIDEEITFYFGAVIDYHY